MKITTEILVALAPAIASAVVGLVVTVGPKMTLALAAFMQSKQKVETLKEVVSHSAFYGSALGGYLGFHHDSSWTYAISVAWFFIMMFGSFRLAKRVEDIEEFEREELVEEVVSVVRKVMGEVKQGHDLDA